MEIQHGLHELFTAELFHVLGQWAEVLDLPELGAVLNREVFDCRRVVEGVHWILRETARHLGGRCAKGNAGM